MKSPYRMIALSSNFTNGSVKYVIKVPLAL